MKTALLVTSFAALAASSVSCGGDGAMPDPVCGDGLKEGTEQCDKGPENGSATSGCSTECRLMSVPFASVQVSYTRLSNEAPGFTGSSCNDLGIGQAHVVVEGPSPADEMWTCATNSRLFSNVTPGAYKATITLYDAGGTAISKPVSSNTVDVMLNMPADLSINFKQSDFLKQDYRGNLDFIAHWGVKDKTCTTASPVVQIQAITLVKAGGGAVPGTTVDGSKLDGTNGPCFEKTLATEYQRVTDLLWGHYDLTMRGQSMGATSFCQKFDVFVGPGVSNRTYDLVVNAATTCP